MHMAAACAHKLKRTTLPWGCALMEGKEVRGLVEKGRRVKIETAQCLKHQVPS